MKILIVEDEQHIADGLRFNLEADGFEVEIANNGEDALQTLEKKIFDAIVLDVMMPKKDGFEVAKALREAENFTPILMLTALGKPEDVLLGFEAGADDYLPKTFSTRELLARLRAVSRRSKISARQTAFELNELNFQDLYINSDTREVLQNGIPLSLTALEFDLLFCLARSAGRVLDRDKLLDEIAGRSYDVFDRSIDVHISSLRRKLGDDSKNPRYIKTIRSVGYMLVAEGKE